MGIIFLVCKEKVTLGRYRLPRIQLTPVAWPVMFM